MESAFRNLDGVYDRNKEKLAGLNKEMRIFRDSLENDFARSLTKAIQGGDGFGAMFKRVGATLEEMVLRLAVVNPAINALFGNNATTLDQNPGDVSSLVSAQGGGLFGSLTKGLFELFSARAAGGPVAGQTPYLVGERGPELFVPHVAGRIQPHGMGRAASSPVNITMHIATPDAASFRASQTQIAAQMLDAARRGSRIR